MFSARRCQRCSLGAQRVLSWSSKADNPIGAEYIIMEKLPGVLQLDEIWNKLDAEARLKVVKRIAKYQADWTAISFFQFGGLYYKQDLPSAQSLVYANKDESQIINDCFAIGPSTSRQNTDDGRKEIEFDRGPCTLCVNINCWSAGLISLCKGILQRNMRLPVA